MYNQLYHTNCLNKSNRKIYISTNFLLNCAHNLCTMTVYNMDCHKNNVSFCRISQIIKLLLCIMLIALNFFKCYNLLYLEML